MSRLRKLLTVLIPVILIFICASPLGRTAGEDNPPPEGFDSWESYYESLLNPPSEEAAVPPLEQMKLAAENDAFRFYYHEEGADLYVIDKRGGKLWSSAIHPDYMDAGSLTPDQRTMLLEVGVADGEGSVSYHSLRGAAGGDFTLSPAYFSDGMDLHIDLTGTGVSFMLEIRLDADGLRYSIPIGSLREGSDHKLVAINAFPAFGAASPEEKGYLFYPDGSGALIDIHKDTVGSQRYSYPLYGSAEQNLDALLESREQDIKNLMLPVFGIRHSGGGMLAAVTGGAETAVLNLYTGDIYGAYFRFDYRYFASVDYNYTGKPHQTQTVSELVPNLMKQTHTVKYFLLSGEESDYSGMARAYRKYLTDSGVLSERLGQTAIPLSLDFFMGIQKSGFFLKTLEALTTFDEAGEILDDLKKQGVEAISPNLSAWSRGGYDAFPTLPEPESKLGGRAGLNRLQEYCGAQGIPLTLGANYVFANTQSGTFNAKKEPLRNWLGKLISNRDETYYLLNPLAGMSKRVTELYKTLPGAPVLNFEWLGGVAVPDYRKRGPAGRDRIIGSYTEALAAAKKQAGAVAVTGGNAYVLPYATRLYEIPDGDSKYYQNSRSVPFYQMVVHGYATYSSLAANLSYSVDYQKLKWIETGSVPHFVLTRANPVVLKDTSYNRIFSSEYSVWRDTLLAVYREMNENLSGFRGQTIDRHEWINKNVVQVTYEQGGRILINYGASPADIESHQVPAMGYLVLGKGR